MSVESFEKILEQWRTSQQQSRGEYIRAHMKILEAISHRHVLWANEANDSETARMHLELVDTLKQARKQAEQLVSTYEKIIMQ